MIGKYTGHFILCIAQLMIITNVPIVASTWEAVKIAVKVLRQHCGAEFILKM